MNAFLYASASLAFVLAIYLATGSGMPKTSRRLLSASMLTIAVLNLLMLLQISDPDRAILLIKPGLAVAFPALLFLHIATVTRAKQNLQLGDAIHIVGPLAAIALRMAPGSGPTLDVLIFLLHLFYVGLIAWVTRHAASSFANLGTPLSVMLDRWRRLVLLFLTIGILLDILIALEVDNDDGAFSHPWVFALVGILLVLGFSSLLVASLHRKGPLAWVGNRYRQHNPEHGALIARLEDKLLLDRIFLDPNLTLSRFSRRVGLPVRDVSTAINDNRSCNYNQWLNKFRIEEAQRMMRDDPERGVTEVMYSSGFQNKSTFNAAFRSLTGESPSVWRNQLDDATR
jgi:AraC-like DNA-binding protein